MRWEARLRRGGTAGAAEETEEDACSTVGAVTGMEGGLWNGGESEEVADWEEGISMETGPTAGLDAVTGHEAGGETDVEAEGSFGFMTGRAAGFWSSGRPRTTAETGTIAGRRAGMRGGWFGLDVLTASLSKGFHIPFFAGRGVILEAGSKTGARTGTAAVDDSVLGDLIDSGTDIAFSIRHCALEGSMTFSSGGGVRPISFASTSLASRGSAGLLWVSLSRSCSAALCSAASTSSRRSLKS